MKKYKFGFDAGGLLFFAAIMIPNLIWFAIPAPNDVMRTAATNPVLDTVSSVSQAAFVAALCFVVRRERGRCRKALCLAAVLCVLVYFLGWIFYYAGFAGRPVLLLLSAVPCAAFALYAVERANFIALAPLFIFAVCHIAPFL